MQLQISPQVQLGEGQVFNPPLYFIVVFWGERFRNYFLDLCLPTLLAPGNLPALPQMPRSKFLICTTYEDWEAMNSFPIFALLKRYVDPVFLEIPPCPPDVHGCIHMGVGHRKACQMAYEAKAYPFVVTPDSMFSDGIISRLQTLAKNGVELVLVPALRFAEEPLFERLSEKGVSPFGRKGAAEPISLTGRELAGLCLPSMHSETQSYEWDAPYFCKYPSATWWRVPGGDRIVVHCLSWAPLLFDFRAVEKHDTSVFDNWTFDGDYVYKNLGNIKKMHLVLDSDEMFIASWAPLADKSYDLTPQPLLQNDWFGGLIRKAIFQRYFYSGVFDPLKQSIFFQPIRWHAADVEKSRWKATESRARHVLTQSVGYPRASAAPDLGRLNLQALLGPPFTG